MNGHRITLANVTIDSSLMYPTTGRRFLMALWEMDGLKIELLPRTVQEMYGFVQNSEFNYWNRGLRKEGQRTGQIWPEETIDAICQASADAAGAWVNEELGYGQIPPRNASMLRAVTMTRKQRLAAKTLASNIPQRCFRGPTKDNYQGDREIIGQGIVSGFKVLASDNRSSLRRNVMNGWLREQNYVAEDFVLSADDAIETAGAWDRQPARLLEAVLRATLPETRRSGPREKAIVDTFLKRLAHEGFRGIAQTCRDEWRGPEISAIYTRARAYIKGPETLARQTETRRLARTREAAEEAGYKKPQAVPKTGPEATRRNSGHER